MTRLALLDDLDAVPAAILDPLLQRRGGTLLKIDRLLLHSPPFAAGWNALLRAVLTELMVEPRLGQLVMTAIAVLNRCEYEAVAHGAGFLAAGGTEVQRDGLRADVRAAARDEALFDETERAVLALAIEMTCDVVVSDATFGAVRRVMADERRLADIVATIATYNMVTRFVVAFDLTTGGSGL